MPKQQITAAKETNVKSPAFQKSQEAEFAKLNKFMIEQIAQRFENQVLNALHKSTISKFEDAQVGNYSKVYLKLVANFKKKILKQFSNDRVESFSNRVTDKTNKANQQALYNMISNKVGIDMQELIRNEAMTSTFNALQLETSQWVKRLRDGAIEEFTARTLQAMSLGTPFEEIVKDFKKSVKPKKNNAAFLARNQIQNFNSVSTKLRAQNLGITRARWITARDEDVRPCHKARDGKEFELSEGLYSSCDKKTLLPGIDFNCRCTYDLIIPTE